MNPVFFYKKYTTNVYWGKMLIEAREADLERAKQNLKEYEDWWARFINYCHTGL